MFNRILSDLTLSNDLANQAFGNVGGDDFNGDGSFVATLRALLLNRVGEDGIRLCVGGNDLSKDDINRHGLKVVINATCPSFTRGKLIIQVARASATEDRAAFFDALDNAESGFVKAYEGFEEMKNIRDFVADKMNARFYTNVERHVTVIFVEMMNNRRWHYIQSFIPRYFKWYFETAPITAEETSLLASLTKKTPEEYERLIEVFAQKLDMRSYLIKAVLGELERGARRQQLNSVDEKIRRIRDKILSLEREYTDAIESLDDMNIRRSGLIDNINNAGDDSELVDYFQSNKSLDPISSEGTSFEFIVKTYLDTWDPELYETLTKKPKSLLFEGYRVRNDAFADRERRKKFFDAIFSDDPLLRIKLCGYYRLDIKGASTSCAGYSYPRTYCDRMPNPHLQKFNCLGNHSRLINAALRNGDTIGAVEQCIASCKSLNLTEPQTYQWFFEKLFATDEKVIELPDHTSVSPADAMQWLLDRETKEEDHKDA